MSICARLGDVVFWPMRNTKGSNALQQFPWTYRVASLPNFEHPEEMLCDHRLISFQLNVRVV